MNSTSKTYRYELDKSSKKYKCPSCGYKTFVLYRDQETNELLPDHVGRCDRENSCAQHYKPKEFFKESGIVQKPFIEKVEVPSPEKIDIIPEDLFFKSFNGFMQTSFALFLTDLFGHAIARSVLLKYAVARSKKDNGKASLFWQIDINSNVRSGKIISYNETSGKRIKKNDEEAIRNGRGLRNKNNEPEDCLSVNPFVKKYLGVNTLNFQQCFFGEHLLSTYPNLPVALVESEKTAIIASLYMPGMLWLATGGVSGCKWREYAIYKALKNRNVILYPDYGYHNGKTCYEEWSERANHIRETLPCTIKVSRLLENKLADVERKDQDLADMLIKRDDGNGPALTDEGYPIMWDLKMSGITNSINV